jgi:hypothetical protein
MCPAAAGTQYNAVTLPTSLTQAQHQPLEGPSATPNWSRACGVERLKLARTIMTKAAVVVCSHCSVQLRIKDPRWLNKQMRCPKCAQVFVGRPAAEASTHAAVQDEFGPVIKPLGSGKPPSEPPPAEPEDQPPPKKRKKRRRKKGDAGIENSLKKMGGYGLAGIGVETGMATSEDSRAGETAAIITILLNIGCRCLIALLLSGEISQAAILDSTSRYDILWFVLSAVISYTIGAGILFD